VLEPAALGARIAESPIELTQIDKARRVLGFEPRVPLTEGLARTIDWFQQGRAKDVAYG